MLCHITSGATITCANVQNIGSSLPVAYFVANSAYGADTRVIDGFLRGVVNPDVEVFSSPNAVIEAICATTVVIVLGLLGNCVCFGPTFFTS